MAPHSSTPAWKIPWTKEPGRLQSMGSQRVGHDWSDLAAAAAAGGSDSKESASNAWDQGSTPGLGRSPWRREWLATHSSRHACRIPWTEEPGVPYSPWGCKEWLTHTRFMTFPRAPDSVFIDWALIGYWLIDTDPFSLHLKFKEILNAKWYLSGAKKIALTKERERMASLAWQEVQCLFWEQK